MPKHVLFYAVHCPCPPKTGEHVRYLQILQGLIDAGLRVSVAGSTLHSETGWTQEGCRDLRRRGVHEVYVHRPGRFGRLANRVERLVQRRFGWKPTTAHALFCPISLRRWFQLLAQRLNLDVLYLNHFWFDQLVSHNGLHGVHRVMEAHVIMSLNSHFYERVNGLINQFKSGGGGEDLFDVNMALTDACELDPVELGVYDRYETIISISEPNRELLQPHLTHARVAWVPMTISGTVIDNDYSGSAVFMAGPNPFNLQGLLYFVHRVLPIIHARAPDFTLEVTGAFKDEVNGVRGVRHAGFVSDLDSVLRRAVMCVCPVFVCTGQQIKIVEAMANGLPVVALKAGALTSPLEHERNGFVANSAGEFAEHAIKLWQDRELCRSIGAVARESSREWCERHDSSRIFADLLR